MRIDFLKMQGLGNDFLVFDAARDAQLDSSRLRALADRHTGVGFDQALMLETPRDAHSRIFYRIFNSDGSEVEQCGNGARCIAALLYARAPQLGRDLVMGSLGGTVRAHVRDDGLVSVDMGVPNFDPRALPMEAAAEATVYSLTVDGAKLEIGAVSMGNPHAVLQVPDVNSAPLERFGPSIEHHPSFPRWGSCKSWGAAAFACGYSNAVWARLWPAAPARAPRSQSAGGADFWMGRCR
jgi:diaminopimelate epimerase